MYVGVELLYKHAGTSRRFLAERFLTLSAKCISRGVLEKLDRITCRSK